MRSTKDDVAKPFYDEEKMMNLKKYQGGFVQGIGKILADAIIGGLILMFIAGVVVGGLLFWGLPVFWEWIKPLLHSWTA